MNYVFADDLALDSAPAEEPALSRIPENRDARWLEMERLVIALTATSVSCAGDGGETETEPDGQHAMGPLPGADGPASPATPDSSPRVVTTPWFRRDSVAEVAEALPPHLLPARGSMTAAAAA